MDTEDTGAALVPSRVEIVEFYGDRITAAETDAGAILVPLRPICESLGLDWSAQSRRLRRDPVLSDAVCSVAITATEAGGQRSMLALPLDVLPGWTVSGLSASRILYTLRIRYADHS